MFICQPRLHSRFRLRKCFAFPTAKNALDEIKEKPTKHLITIPKKIFLKKRCKEKRVKPKEEDFEESNTPFPKISYFFFRILK